MSFSTPGGAAPPPPSFSNPDPGPPPDVSERIASLSRIDEQISTLLLTASSCVQALAPPSNNSSSTQPQSFAERRAQFIHSAEEYQRLITKITNGLQKEVVELTNAQLWGGMGNDGAVEVGMEGKIWGEGREWVEDLKKKREEETQLQ